MHNMTPDRTGMKLVLIGNTNHLHHHEKHHLPTIAHPSGHYQPAPPASDSTRPGSIQHTPRHRRSSRKHASITQARKIQKAEKERAEVPTHSTRSHAQRPLCQRLVQICQEEKTNETRHQKTEKDKGLIIHLFKPKKGLISSRKSCCQISNPLYQRPDTRGHILDLPCIFLGSNLDSWNISLASVITMSSCMVTSG